MNENVKKKKKGFKLPHPYIILMTIMLITMALTYIIPSGVYDKVLDPATGKMVVDADSFKYIDKTVFFGPMDYFTAIYRGMTRSMGLGALLFVISGAVFLFEENQALGAGIYRLLSSSKGKEFTYVLIILGLFTVLGAIGFGESGFPFLPLTILLCMRLGYDRVVGTAAGFLGICIGWASGALNVFTTAISQEMVGLPIYSGIGFRVFGLLVFFVICALYLRNYAKRIKKDPNRSYVSEEYINQINKDEQMEPIELTTKRKVALGLLGLAVVLQIFGTLKLSWGIPEISAVYIIISIVTAFIFRMEINKACLDFTKGAARMLQIVFCISIANAVMQLMTEGQILDTIVYNISLILKNKSSFVVVILLYLIISAFNFFVISGPGKAVLLIPVISPLGKVLGINQQLIVLLYNYGDGLTNFIYPTSGGLLAGLALCDLSYEAWARFSIKLMVQLFLAGGVLVLIAYKLNYGPF